MDEIGVYASALLGKLTIGTAMLLNEFPGRSTANSRKLKKQVTALTAGLQG
jgi:hypothetical protein